MKPNPKSLTSPSPPSSPPHHPPPSPSTYKPQPQNQKNPKSFLFPKNSQKNNSIESSSFLKNPYLRIFLTQLCETQVTDKQLIIIAGANGSGKTTFAIPYIKELGYDFLNADEIAKELELQGHKSVMIKAGRIFFNRLNKNIEEGVNFVVETTLSGTYINKVAIRAKKAGFNIAIIYIFLDDAELCVERVKTRVIKGGHHVPTEDIIRRFYRSKENFWKNFTQLADEWHLLYNGEESFQQVAIGAQGQFSIENELLFSKFKNIKL